MQAGRLDESQAASRVDQEAWTRLQDRAHGPGRVVGSRLQAERSELIWQQGGPSCRQRRQEAGEMAWRQGSLEIWRVGGREVQPQAGRSGLGWRLGRKEGSAAGRKISSWVGSQEARAAGREDKGQRCRQGGAGRAASPVHGAEAWHHREPSAGHRLTPQDTRGHQLSWKRPRRTSVCAGHQLTSNSHPQLTLQTGLLTVPEEDKPLAATGRLVNIPASLASNIIHSSSLHRYQ